MTKYFQSTQSFEKIFKEYFNPLLNYINQYIRDWEQSREIVQNTFLKVWQNKDSLDIHSSVKSYLYQASRNTMIDYIRKSKKSAEFKQEMLEKLSQEDSDLKLNPFLIRQAITEALKNLKPKNRKIFELNKFEGLTYKEIAQHLDISQRSVEDNIRRAVRILREKLKDHPDLVI